MPLLLGITWERHLRNPGKVYTKGHLWKDLVPNIEMSVSEARLYRVTKDKFKIFILMSLEQNIGS